MTGAAARRNQKKVVGEICRYCLLSIQQNKPIKRTELTKICKTAAIPARMTTDTINTASQKLKHAFGLELIPDQKIANYFLVVENTNRSDLCTDDDEKQRSQFLNNAGTAAVVDNNMNAASNSSSSSSSSSLSSLSSSASYRGLISYVSGLLLLNGGSITKSDFEYQFFQKLDTSEFGSPKQIIQYLKQQKWLTERKDANNQCFYEIGSRLNIESRSEWQYSSCYELVNKKKPAMNDEGLQRIIHEKQNHGNNESNSNSNSNRNSNRSRSQNRRRQR